PASRGVRLHVFGGGGNPRPYDTGARTGPAVVFRFVEAAIYGRPPLVVVNCTLSRAGVNPAPTTRGHDGGPRSVSVRRGFVFRAGAAGGGDGGEVRIEGPGGSVA